MTFVLRFRLTRDGPLHLLRQVYILDFHGGDFDAPWFCLLIDDPLEIRVVLLKTWRSTSRMGPRCHIFSQANVSTWSTRKGGSMP